MEENFFKNKKSPLKKKKTNRISIDNLNFKMSIKSKKLKQEQMKYDKLIEEISTEITKKLSLGIDEFNLKLSTEVNLQDLVKYILKKDFRSKNHVVIIRYYLFQFPTLLEAMNLSLKYYENKDILNKIAIHLKKEEIKKNHIVFYNGQIGKTFYIILEGEVSVLLPTEYSVEITMEKYLDYLKYLYNLQDYELLRLSYESNKNILERYDYEMDDELRNFDYGFDKVLPSSLFKEEIDAQGYINRFSFLDFGKSGESEKIDEIKKLNISNINNKSETENFKNNSDDNIYSNLDKFSNNLNDSNTSNYSIVQKNIVNEIEEDKKYTKNQKKHIFSLWKYAEIIKLGKGKCFGEIALQNVKNRRTATVIALTDCLFGTLGKDEYLLFVRETMEKMRRNNIERLLNTRLFQGITYISFESKLFNCFIYSKEKKGTYLFKRGDKRKYLTYIKKGEIQLEILATCKQLDNILLSIGVNPFDRYINNLIKDYPKIKEFINTPKKFNISIFSKGDIIGTDELIYLNSNVLNLDKKYYYLNNNLNNSNINLEENCFIFNAIFLTNCETFKLDVNFLNSMLKDKVIKNNYDKMLRDKKERLIERLLNIKKNVIFHYFNLINDNKHNTINGLNNLNEKKNFAFLLNNKNSMSNKQIFKNFHTFDSQKLFILNKINAATNTRNNSFLEDKSKYKGKTKEFFESEQTNIKQRNNENYEFQKRALLESFINTNSFKIKLNKKVYFSGNNTLHKFNSEKMMAINKNKTYYNSNIKSVLNKITLTKNNINLRNTLTNFTNNTVLSNDDISKNNSSDKMSMYKSLYPIKRPKKLKLSEVLLNSFKNPEIKMLKDQRIPKLLLNNALIYNVVIDKILLRSKTKKNIFKNTMLLNNKINNTIEYNNVRYNENNKIFNSFDALAFDDILNNIKNNNIQNIKKFFPIFDLPKSNKKFKNQPLPRTTYNFLMKKNKKV